MTVRRLASIPPSSPTPALTPLTDMSTKTLKTRSEIKRAQKSKSASLGTFIKIKGYADILTGVIIAAKPALVYESAPAKWWHEVTGFHLSDATTAPGFNHAIACMVIAIGFGSIVAARSGPAAYPSVFASQLVWGALCLLTSASAFVDFQIDFEAWGIGPGGSGQINSATGMLTGMNHLVFCTAMWFLDNDGVLKKGL
ncbi:hypothetical protein AAF712_007999 [Marasmius tenuissimus]|uniref:Uncharacterized protein n=1 Tax=Marasmius tenuissimus TaxID=585030 RepID=A0ABR2ZXK1_9AGAR